QQEKIQAILCKLSAENDPPETPHAWLDWLEAKDKSSFTWESLTAPQRQQVSRMTVEAPPPSKGGEGQPFVLSREQAIWKKALERHERMKKGPRIPAYAIFLVLLAGLGFVQWKYSFLHLIGEQVREMLTAKKTETKPTVDPSAFTHSAIFWGSYSCGGIFPLRPGEDGLPSANYAFLASLEESGLPETAGQWVDGVLSRSVAPAGWSRPLLWLSLWGGEHGLKAEKNLQESATRLNLPNYRDGEHRWKWTRYDGEGHQLAEGTFEEKANATKGSITLEVKRLGPSGGMASRAVIDALGIREWVWRVKHGDAMIDGQVKRDRDLKSYIITHVSSAPGWKNIEHTLSLPGSRLVLPGFWTPLLGQQEEGHVVLPFLGKFMSARNFYPPLKMRSSEGGDLEITPYGEDWYEAWRVIP
ncbi:MAG: hypothetical protein HQL31_08960, partial [Planctomycetes bacterium]|nr:hypothetical protein [Planctomycetota bacterium]